MIYLGNDYSMGAHHKVLEKLIETNDDMMGTYWEDKATTSAARKIKNWLNADNVSVTFLTGGTQTNKIALDLLLDKDEHVLSPFSAHINLHEAGAIEADGHKIVTLESDEGKINSKILENYMDTFNNDDFKVHMTCPRVVYITFPTELGTLYTKQELKDLYSVCQKNNLLLYIDGARLGYGLAAIENDITPNDIYKYSDAFYIGGTKIGALSGEALVMKSNITPKRLKTKVKRHGALLAKSRLNSLQFDALFTDNLYNQISTNAIAQANKLKKLLVDKGYKLFMDSKTNQQFVIIDNEKMEALSKNVVFSFWEKYDDKHTVIRFVTNWKTTDDDINQLEKIL